MPFASKKQRRWMHKNKPEIAQRWENEEKVRSFKPKKGFTRSQLRALKNPDLSHPLAGITPKPTEKEADELMSNLPITDKKLKSMGKKRKKIRSFKPKKKGLLEGQGYY